jgi:hypothetical protein
MIKIYCEQMEWITVFSQKSQVGLEFFPQEYYSKTSKDVQKYIVYLLLTNTLPCKLEEKEASKETERIQ